MVRSPSFAGVILAAGESSRMGTDKALLPWPPLASGQSLAGETFLSAAIRSLALADFVLIVAGKNEEVLAPVVYASGASLIVNPDPAQGQFSSLQVGLREILNRGRDAAIVTLIDRPPVSTVTVQTLRDAFDAAGDDIWAVIPEFSGTHGHPIVVGREMIEAFLRASPDSSAREVLAQHQDRLRYLAVNDPSIALNINTPEEYKQLEAQSGIL
jgi:molybdenum cofactor cytidylyltransferase